MDTDPLGRPTPSSRLQREVILVSRRASCVTNSCHTLTLRPRQVSPGRQLDHTRLRIGSPGADQKRRVKCSSTFGEETPKITRASLCRRPHRPGAAAGSRPDSSAENRGTIIAESGQTQPQLLRGTLNSCRIPEPAPTEEKQSGARTREFSPSALFLDCSSPPSFDPKLCQPAAA